MSNIELKALLKEVLDEHHSSPDEHDEHHDWVKLQIKRDKRRQELIQKFKLSFVGILATSAVGGLIWLGKFVLEHLFHANI